MDSDDDSFDSDFEEEAAAKDSKPPKKGTSSVLSSFESELGLFDLPKDFLQKQKEASQKNGVVAKESSKKRRRKKSKVKHLMTDPFAAAGTQSNPAKQFYKAKEDSSWMAKMGLTNSGRDAKASNPVEVVTFTSRKRGPTATPKENDGNRLDGDVATRDVDIDMEKTRLEIMKYDIESGNCKGKKKQAAKMKAYLEKLGARPQKLSAYRNPEHKQNYVKKLRKTENKERRVRKEMGLKVENHDERRKEKMKGKKKRKELGIGTVGKWNDKSAMLKV